MFSRLDLPLQAAQAQRRAAAAAARLGEHARARELLHAAHATADQLGARHLRESCTAALRQLGDTPRRQPVLAPRDRRPHQPRTGRHAAGGAGKHQQANRPHLVHQPAHRRDARPQQHAKAAVPDQGRSGTPAHRTKSIAPARHGQTRAGLTTPPALRRQPVVAGAAAEPRLPRAPPLRCEARTDPSVLRPATRPINMVLNRSDSAGRLNGLATVRPTGSVTLRDG